jgi:hypothetical protein
LRAAIVLRQRNQNRAALIVTVGVAKAAAAEPLDTGGDLVEVPPHLLDLVVDRTALRRLAVEKREKPRTVATHAPGLRRHAIELALLPCRGILVAAHLFVPGRVPAAAMLDGRQLRFQPRAHRIDRRALRHWRPRRIGLLGVDIGAQHGATEQGGAGQDPSGQGGDQLFRHIRPLQRARATNHGGAKVASHSRFSGQRHVVSGAPVWQENP